MAARPLSTFLAFALFALSGGRAAAIDLTGTWREVKNAPCRELKADGTETVYKDPEVSFSDLEITQSAAVLAVRANNIPLTGYVFSDAKHDVGRGIIQRCPDGILYTFQIVSAKTFPESSKGVSGKMTTFTIEGLAGATFTCKVFWERTSTADPAAPPGCP